MQTRRMSVAKDVQTDSVHKWQGQRFPLFPEHRQLMVGNQAYMKVERIKDFHGGFKTPGVHKVKVDMEQVLALNFLNTDVVQTRA